MLQTSQRLGDFEIIRLLGKGGMGQVYEAQQFNPSRRVALKVLAPWLAQDEEALKRFWREAEVPAQLDHPGIVRIISTGKTDDGIAFYAMQLVQGISAAELIRRAVEAPQPSTVPQRRNRAETPFRNTPEKHFEEDSSAPDREAVDLAIVSDYVTERYRTVARIGAQVARALAHAHRCGFLHRDIKPSNLMIDEQGQVWLVDFGLTRALCADGGISQAGTVRGTAWYMSPEQARGDPLDERSDIYSLGVTLYELASQGQGPFTGSRQNSDAVLAQVKAGQTLPLRVFAPDVPIGLERVINRAMEFRPQKRYVSTDDLAADLDKLLEDSGSALTPASRYLPRRRSRLKPALIGLLTLIAVGLLAAGAASFKGSSARTGAAGEPPALKPVREPLEVTFARQRPWRVRTPLLREDLQPILHERILGEGVFQGQPPALVINSFQPGFPTYLALDCPKENWFEFSIELRTPFEQTPHKNRIGVFFGWNDPALDDPLGRWRHFIVEVAERPMQKDKYGRAFIATAIWEDVKGARAGGNQSFCCLPDKRGIIPLAKPEPTPHTWHNVLVRVLHSKVTVTIDQKQTEKFDIDWLRQHLQTSKNAQIDPRGGLGIWVMNGIGEFRNATIMALPDSEPD